MKYMLIILTAIIIYLTRTMANHPYSSEDLRSAYYHGCNYGTIYGKPMSDESIARCQKTSQIFKYRLEWEQ